MYKVVIADDNNLIREALKKTIPWSRLDCVVAAEAEDGIEEKEASRDRKSTRLNSSHW